MFLRKWIFVSLAVISAFALATPAFAHVTLEVPKAHIGSSYKAVLRVPHGCKGSATTAIKVQIPEGVIGAKPQPKPGWKLATKQGDYAKTHTLYGSKVSSGVPQIDWTGGDLPDAYYDEFVLLAI